MGLLDKVKNLFTDEEIIEEEDDDVVSIHEIKKEEKKENKKVKKEKTEDKLPTFMREKIEEERKMQQPDFTLSKDSFNNINVTNNNSEILNDDDKVVDNKYENVVKTNDSFKFPIDVNDEDFVGSRVERNKRPIIKKDVEIVKNDVHSEPKKEVTKSKVADLYKDKKEEKPVEKKFRATPIISPVYGVLDKNYQTSQIQQSDSDDFERQRPSKSVDFDTVRKKAYGSLADDIKENLMCENCEYLKEVKSCRKKKKDDSRELMYDIMDDSLETKTSYDSNLVKDSSVNYDDSSLDNSYKFDSIDDFVDDSDNLNEDILNNNVNTDINDYKEHTKKEVPPIKSKINLLSTLKKSAGDYANGNEDSKNEKDLELTDDLFNIIDSMYEERNDK